MILNIMTSIRFIVVWNQTHSVFEVCLNLQVEWLGHMCSKIHCLCNTSNCQKNSPFLGGAKLSPLSFHFICSEAIQLCRKIQILHQA
ncbi:unnamed protein product [Gulo gulo]|uniref:Uncharacterized protein n=1 Tax=Gulo gulo TaxID=48420 RepID=A0A9X9M6B3_GULGU|nr:unnamed protein product [Gulo gulo]